MSIWTRIAEALRALAAGEGLAAVLERLSTPPERSVAFTIGVIALGAKLAKADGAVTRDEVAAFRQIFTIPRRAEAEAARVFNLARQDVAGYEYYAERVARMFTPGSPVLADLLDGLFAVAVADGDYHPDEDRFLSRVAEIFGFSPRDYACRRALWAPDRADPWSVLGVEPGADPEAVRARWRALVRETHPDRMIARGLPEEAVKLATARLARINAAYEAIMETA
jgi:DnaJ like chaperone protein